MKESTNVKILNYTFKLLKNCYQDDIIGISHLTSVKDIIESFENSNELIDLYYIDTLSINNVHEKFISKIKEDNIENKLYIFINNNFSKTQLISGLINKFLINIDEYVNRKISILLYLKYDFRYKRSLHPISSLHKFLLSDIDYKKNENICYVGQTGTSGYATAAIRYIADYVMRKIPVSWKPLVFDNSKLDLTSYVNILANTAIDRKLDTTDMIILHSTPDIWEKLYNRNCGSEYKRAIGYCAWESNTLPISWVKAINENETIDEIWVPSTFNKQCFEFSGIKNKIIKVVPHLYFKTQDLIPKSDIMIKDCLGNIIDNTKYTFYNISEFIDRKGIIELIQTFDRLYEKNKNIQLILKLHYKKFSFDSIKYIIDTIKQYTFNFGKSIFIIYKGLTEHEVLLLHSFGDCYISLTKGEGFGLTIFDAFKLKKELIVTGYGGHLDFLGQTHPGLVDYKLKSVNEEKTKTFNYLYTHDQLWAYPDLDHCYSLMENKIK